MGMYMSEEENLLLQEALSKYPAKTKIRTIENGSIVEIPDDPYMDISACGLGVLCSINGWPTWIVYNGQWAEIIPKDEDRVVLVNGMLNIGDYLQELDRLKKQNSSLKNVLNSIKVTFPEISYTKEINDILGQLSNKNIEEVKSKLQQDIVLSNLSFKGTWKNAKINPPSEDGRYWVLVEEVNDLGISYFQWNCSYHEFEKRWSDNLKNYNVIWWTELAPLPF